MSASETSLERSDTDSVVGFAFAVVAPVVSSVDGPYTNCTRVSRLPVETYPFRTASDVVKSVATFVCANGVSCLHAIASVARRASRSLPFRILELIVATSYRAFHHDGREPASYVIVSHETPTAYRQEAELLRPYTSGYRCVSLLRCLHCTRPCMLATGTASSPTAGRHCERDLRDSVMPRRPRAVVHVRRAREPSGWPMPGTDPVSGSVQSRSVG